MLKPLWMGLREYFARQEQAGHRCTVVHGADPEEAMPGEPGHPTPPAYVVEDATLKERPTGFRTEEHSTLSEFRFFLDGVQYSHLIGYVDNVPLVHHLSAAAILERDAETRRLHVWRWSGVCERVLVPKEYVDYDLLLSLGVPLLDTMVEGTPCEAVALRALAQRKSQQMRRSIEEDLIRAWATEQPKGWLMVDGPLAFLHTPMAHVRMVGVVKSFGGQFFSGEQQLRVMRLAQGCRTSVFQLPRGSGPAAADALPEQRHWYSWYVRIREPRGRDTDFGLLRVEVPPDPGVLEQADAISRWLIAERAPLSTPDPRWDNLLYPIHACELYLRSMLPERRRVHLHLR